MSETRIIIFAKAPVPGRVKTRLIPALGEEGAALLARRMLLSTIAEALAARVGPVELCADPDPRHTAWDDLLSGHALDLSLQGAGDLGDRLSRAAERTLSTGTPVILIGTDCPALDRRRLVKVSLQLRHSDAMIHPARDGGYVALGLNRYDRSLFTGIAWSTAAVAGQTIERIQSLGWSLTLGATLRDIDVPADLEAVRSRTSRAAI